MIKYSDSYWINIALKLAQYAQKEGEIPVGALLVLNNKIIGKGWNQSIKNNDPIAHAEIVALRHGAKILKNYRLLNTTLYSTLEPCIMCSGAVIHSRINRLVYGASNQKNGAVDSLINILHNPNIHHKIEIVSGVLKEKCIQKLNNFFILCRKKNKQNKNKILKLKK
ncbi:tRNA-specific adenosine deaminase [Serratia symbiotica]|nr:tRNA-specific adenosine deaminase [Serratia symbiotica]